jgi:S-adenosylmethionine-diacylglycerol 3-amino-3-carboxypropyl transferase
MRAGEFERLKSMLPRLELRTISLEAFLETPEAAEFDAWSLSDFSSYSTAQQHEAIWRTLAQTLPPGATVCERRFLVKLEPKSIGAMRLDRSLAAALDATDRSFVYDFNVARKTSDAVEARDR